MNKMLMTLWVFLREIMSIQKNTITIFLHNNPILRDGKNARSELNGKKQVD